MNQRMLSGHFPDLTKMVETGVDAVLNRSTILDCLTIVRQVRIE